MSTSGLRPTKETLFRGVISSLGDCEAAIYVNPAVPRVGLPATAQAVGQRVILQVRLSALQIDADKVEGQTTESQGDAPFSLPWPSVVALVADNGRGLYWTDEGTTVIQAGDPRLLADT